MLYFPAIAPAQKVGRFEAVGFSGKHSRQHAAFALLVLPQKNSDRFLLL
jgi:hypothetical protein